MYLIFNLVSNVFLFIFLASMLVASDNNGETYKEHIETIEIDSDSTENKAIIIESSDLKDLNIILANFIEEHYQTGRFEKKLETNNNRGCKSIKEKNNTNEDSSEKYTTSIDNFNNENSTYNIRASSEGKNIKRKSTCLENPVQRREKYSKKSKKKPLLKNDKSDKNLNTC